jgi:hypothetical protein
LITRCAGMVADVRVAAMAQRLARLARIAQQSRDRAIGDHPPRGTCTRWRTPVRERAHGTAVVLDAGTAGAVNMCSTILHGAARYLSHVQIESIVCKACPF